jgi:hypothetical protein
MSQLWIPTGERCGLSTRIAATVNASSRFHPVRRTKDNQMAEFSTILDKIFAYVRDCGNSEKWLSSQCDKTNKIAYFRAQL